MYKILIGDATKKLNVIPDETVQCCVTSPPYWGLRDYGVPGQIGLEKTPEEYVAKMVEVFRGVRRVLRKDGTLWLNLGDSYNGSGGPGSQWDNKKSKGKGEFKKYDNPNRGYNGLKPKDLCMIPARVALALQADGWWLRSDIIWNKPNPMPESVTDRPTKSHEYIFLLTKSAKYYYDANAIREPLSAAMLQEMQAGYNGKAKKKYAGTGAQDPSDVKSRILANRHKNLAEDGQQPHSMHINGSNGNGEPMINMLGSNRKSVWTITTKPYGGAHFATFPPEIPEMCIKAGSKDGDTVLDPFCGSGTTGEIALRMNRNFIGIELNQKYAEELISPRLQNVNPLFSDSK